MHEETYVMIVTPVKGGWKIVLKDHDGTILCEGYRPTRRGIPALAAVMLKEHIS